MKKIFVLFAFILSVVAVNAQKEVVYARTVDTVKGNENIYITAGILRQSAQLTMELDFSKISTAAGGTAYLQGSVNGTTYSTLTSTDDLFIFFPNDTVTITDAGTMKVIVKDNPLVSYRWFIDGDVNDTVICKPYSIYK